MTTSAGLRSEKNMDFRRNSMRIPAKKVYFVDGHAFMSDKGTKNGKSKAEEYCKKNFIPLTQIVVFDSVMEYHYYAMLKAQEEEGKVRDIRFHVMFPLVPESDNLYGMHHNPIDYEADFMFQTTSDGKWHVVDVKGFIEDVFVIKWALFDRIYKERGVSLECYRINPRMKGMWSLSSAWEKVEINTGAKKKSATLQRLRDENKAYRKKEHDEEMAKRKKERENARIAVLEARLKADGRLSKADEKRLQELKERHPDAEKKGKR